LEHVLLGGGAGHSSGHGSGHGAGHSSGHGSGHGVLLADVLLLLLLHVVSAARHLGVGVATTTVLLVTVDLVVGAVVLVVATLVVGLVLVVHGGTALGVGAHVGAGAGLLALNGRHQQAEETGDLVVVLEVNLLDVLSLVALEILLILVRLVLEVTLLLHLVVVDVERAAVKLELGVLDLGGSVGGLEAHEGKGHLVVLLTEELERLDLAVGSKQLLKVLLGGGGLKVLDIEVATLLGVLVLKSLVLELLLALLLLKGGLNVKTLLTVLICGDGLSSALGSVLAVGDVLA
jgi:hypothetical protein